MGYPGRGNHARMRDGDEAMNADEAKKAAVDGAEKIAAWAKANPEIVKAICYIALGILTGWFLFYG